MSFLSPSASNSPIFCLKNASILYLGTRAHCWPRIPGHLMLLILKENLATSRRKGLTPRRTRGYWILSSLVCCSVGPPRCCEGLRRSVECFAAAYSRLLLSFSFSSLLQVFPSRYLASLLLTILSCPAKIL